MADLETWKQLGGGRNQAWKHTRVHVMLGGLGHAPSEAAEINNIERTEPSSFAAPLLWNRLQSANVSDQIEY